MKRYIPIYITLLFSIISCASAHHNKKQSKITSEENDYLFDKYYWVSYPLNKSINGKLAMKIEDAILYFKKHEIEVINTCDYDQLDVEKSVNEPVKMMAIKIKLQDLKKAEKLGWKVSEIEPIPGATLGKTN